MKEYMLLPVDVLTDQDYDITNLEIYIGSSGGFKCIKEKGKELTTPLREKLFKLKKNKKDKVLIKIDKDILNFCDSTITQILEKEKNFKKALTNVKQLMQSLFEYVSLNPEKENFHAITDTNEKLSKFIQNNPRVAKLTIATLKKDFATSIHVINVHLLVSNFACFLGMKNNSLNKMINGAYFHDIGKIKIPDEILKKPGKLTKEEYSTIQKHTTYGYELLKEMDLSQYSLMALEHHEFMDGSGYPHGLKDGEILLESKIIQICDIYEALIGTRPYRDALDYFSALELLRDSFVKKGKITQELFLKFLEFIKINER